MTQPTSPAHPSNPYLNPALAEYLDSFEGITWPQAHEQPQEAAARGPARSRLHERFESLGVLAPGLALALTLAAIAKWVAPWLGVHVFRQQPGFEPERVPAGLPRSRLLRLAVPPGPHHASDRSHCRAGSAVRAEFRGVHHDAALDDG